MTKAIRNFKLVVTFKPVKSLKCVIFFIGRKTFISAWLLQTKAALLLQHLNLLRLALSHLFSFKSNVIKLSSKHKFFVLFHCDFILMLRKAAFFREKNLNNQTNACVKNSSVENKRQKADQQHQSLSELAWYQTIRTHSPHHSKLL